MYRLRLPGVVVIAIVLAFAPFAQPVFAQPPVPIDIVTWNTGLDDADLSTITDRIRTFDGIEIWMLQEVWRANAASAIAAAVEDGENANYTAILGDSGRDLRLLTIFNADRFQLLDGYEIAHINTTGNARAPLVLQLRDKLSGETFLLMNNHLYRSRDDERWRQATLLNEWARSQTIPVIAAGDYNFDWDYDNGEADHDTGYDNMTADGIWQWVRPERLVPTQCTDNLPCTYDEILVFVFVSGAAQQWQAISDVVVEPGDFPDDQLKSDHRPVRARFVPLAARTSTVTLPTPTPAPQSPAGPSAARSANLRAGPGTTFPIVGGVDAGAPLKIAGQTTVGNDAWYQLASGAWIAGFLVAGVPNVPAVAAPTTEPPRVETVQIPTPVPPLPTAALPPPPPTAVPDAPARSGGNCDPHYPDVCIPPPPPDLDCGQISPRMFRVVGGDPHRFDRDSDGWGCEG